jgi:hypothetical protein
MLTGPKINSQSSYLLHVVYLSPAEEKIYTVLIQYLQYEISTKRFLMQNSLLGVVTIDA